MSAIPTTGPFLVHVVTKKGKGYSPAEKSDDKYHGVSKFNVLTGEQKKSTGGPPSYTKVFAEALVAEAERDEKIVAITAAMPSGTGLDLFASRFPKRFFDVGAAEQHAVTFAAGLAAEGVPSIRRDIFDVPAARLRSSRARCRHPVPSRALRHRPRGPRRRGWTNPCRCLRCDVSLDLAGIRGDGGRR